jgi:prophage antirepressor-like protein
MSKPEIFSYKGSSFVVYNNAETACFKIGDILYSLQETAQTDLAGRLEDSDFTYFHFKGGNAPDDHEGVNEKGLLRLILTSPNRDDAEHFYNWVKNYILPYTLKLIRKKSDIDKAECKLIIHPKLMEQQTTP